MEKVKYIDKIIDAYQIARMDRDDIEKYYESNLHKPFPKDWDFAGLKHYQLALVQSLISDFLILNHVHPDKQSANAEFSPQYEEFEGLPFSDVKEGD